MNLIVIIHRYDKILHGMSENNYLGETNIRHVIGSVHRMPNPAFLALVSEGEHL